VAFVVQERLTSHLPWQEQLSCEGASPLLNVFGCPAAENFHERQSAPAINQQVTDLVCQRRSPSA